MKNRAPKLIASAFLVLTLATACGGDGRPSVDEISDALQDSDLLGGSELTDDQVDCLAKAYHDSDLSDDALQALVDGDEDYKGSKEDTEDIGDVSEAAGKCATS